MDDKLGSSKKHYGLDLSDACEYVEPSAVGKKLLGTGITEDDYNAFTDESIKDNHIIRIKQLELPKPPKISLKRWNDAFEITERHQQVILMAAMGKPRDLICEETGYSPSRVAQLLAMPKIKAKVLQKQDQLYSGKARDYIKTLLNQSYGVIQEILENNDEKSSVRLEAAKYIIDHTIGRANQNVNVNHSLLIDVMNKLDQQEHLNEVKKDVIDIQSTPAEPAYTQIEAPKDVADSLSATAVKEVVKVKNNMDDLVNNILGDKSDFTVGKRASEGGKEKGR